MIQKVEITLFSSTKGVFKLNRKNTRKLLSFLLAIALLLLFTSTLRAGGTTIDDYGWSSERWHLSGTRRAADARG